ncbi:MAG: TRAP transporter small permease [Desulfobacterales bacterium]|nr:TRAP transporter small permease [Desulfobacterales bacterium]
MLAFLNNISRGVNRWIQGLVCTMGMTMAVIVAVQVFCRYVLNHSLFWSEELARLILVWLTFLGATVAYYHRAHPGVDGLYRRLPPVWQKGAALLTHGAGLALFSVMIFSGVQFAWFVRLQITPALNLPKWVLMAVVPVAGVIFVVHVLAFIVQTLAADADAADLEGRTDDH